MCRDHEIFHLIRGYQSRFLEFRVRVLVSMILERQDQLVREFAWAIIRIV